jgi:hypothetical protein
MEMSDQFYGLATALTLGTHCTKFCVGPRVSLDMKDTFVPATIKTVIHTQTNHYWLNYLSS